MDEYGGSPPSSAAPVTGRKAERLLAMLDALDVVVWEADSATGRLTYVSRGVERLLGYAPADWLAPGFRERVLHPDDRGWVTACWSRPWGVTAAEELDYRVIAADGRCVWVRESVRVVPPEASLAGALQGALVDVTREKQALLASRDEAPAEVTGARPLPRVTHDLNNAVTALFGFAGVLSTWLHDRPEALRHLDDLRAAAERVADLTAELRGREARAESAAPPPSRTRIVLVAEDEEMVRRLMTQALRRDGWTVLEAATGDDALRLARQHRGAIDLLVADIVMPGMSGRDLAERLRGERADLPVLFVTGYSSEADPRRLTGPGTGLLLKPFLPGAFVAKVRALAPAAAR